MRIYLCQTKPILGDFEHNSNNIKMLYNKALEAKADVMILPELALSGYMAHDLLMYQDFIDNIVKHNADLVAYTQQTALILPTVVSEEGRLKNSAIIAQNGKIIDITYKNNLVNCGILNETRYFTKDEPREDEPRVVKINQRNFGILIGEDLWHPVVAEGLNKSGTEIFLSLNASPFEQGKFSERMMQIDKLYQIYQKPIIYCNQVIGQDGIIFDGGSMAHDGAFHLIGKKFDIDENIIDVMDGKLIPQKQYNFIENFAQDAIDAMVLGVHDYVKHNGFSKVILGLSGGIDSAIVAYVAVKALGKENVTGYMIPSKYTSQSSKTDALQLAENLGITLQTIDISTICDSFSQQLNLTESSIAHQNLQSRIRGTVLMSEANQHNALLLTTGNKSECAAGYATIYGDMNGAFNPIKDIYKTELYDIAHHINLEQIIIPLSIINKAPSAELRPDQKDSDSLPAYDILDPILKDYIDERKTLEALYKSHDKDTVDRVIKLVNNSEFKRRQSAPGVKISQKSFDVDRNIPITWHYTNSHF